MPLLKGGLGLRGRVFPPVHRTMEWKISLIVEEVPKNAQVTLDKFVDLTMKRVKKHCGLCRREGHNRRTCTYKTDVNGRMVV